MLEPFHIRSGQQANREQSDEKYHYNLMPVGRLKIGMLIDKVLVRKLISFEKWLPIACRGHRTTNKKNSCG